jgi:beta-lactamase class A
MNILKTSLPLWLVLLICAGIGTGSFFLFGGKNTVEKSDSLNVNNNCGIVLMRASKHGEFTRPLIMADSPTESTDLLDLKNNIIETINNAEVGGGITRASVYFRSIESGKWMAVNGGEQFSMASIMKVLTMIYHLRQNEQNPGWLNQRVKLIDYTKGNIQTIEGPTLQIGKEYTIEELMKYMIMYSNNEATANLNVLMDFKAYGDLMQDIGIPVPDPKAPDYTLNSVECSRFLRVLYNTSVLTNKSSEYALKLLSQSTYRGGLLRQISEKDLKVAHKFGERFLPNENQLHETAIFYTDSNPYLLTVLTGGKDTAQEAALIGKIGALVYDYNTKPKAN